MFHSHLYRPSSSSDRGLSSPIPSEESGEKDQRMVNERHEDGLGMIVPVFENENENGR